MSTIADESDGDFSAGDLSLREAIEMTNASVDSLVIGFASSLAGETIQLNSQIDITNDVGIIGLGADNLTIDGNGQTRLFSIAAGTDVAMRELTFTRGVRPQVFTPVNDVSNSGGGFLNLGTLTLIESRLAHHQGQRGGAIYSSGELILEGVEFDSNAATVGGAVYTTTGGPGTGKLTAITTLFTENRASVSGGAVFLNAPAEISRSLFLENSAGGQGGAVWTSSGGPFSIVNSTLVGNYSDNASGGAIESNGTVTITNSTVVGNWAGKFNAGTGTGVGGGIAVDQDFGSLTLNNTVVAGNFGGPLRLPNDLSYGKSGPGGRVSGGFNLIGNATTSAELTDGVNGNIVGDNGTGTIDIATVFFDANEDGEISELDLLNFSGPLRSFAPELDSPLIDAGDNSLALDPVLQPLVVDQRGQPRIRDGNLDQTATVDIGAYEDPAPFVVDSKLDLIDAEDGVTTLREALNFANIDMSQDHRIRFAPSLAGSTIVLDGDFLPLSQGAIFISGLGEDSLTVDANGLSRVFEIQVVAIGTIDGLTITGGASFTPEDPPQDGGGGIWSEGVLNLARSRVTGNKADTFRAGGGGVRNSFGATATILATKIDGNTATNQHGGGFSNSGTAIIIDSVLEQNQAKGSGGAIYSYHGVEFPATLTISGSQITGNTAESAGGAIWGSGANSTIEIAGSLFENNRTVNNTGGAIWAEGTPLTVRDSEFIGNQDGFHGGGAIRALSAPVEIVRSKFIANISKTFGGAIAMSANDPLTVIDSYFEGNEAATSGGAIFHQNAPALISGSTFVDNKSGGLGGAIRLERMNNPARIETSTFIGNQSQVDGGAVSASVVLLAISDSTFLRNQAVGSGGALVLHVGTPFAVTNSTFVENKATFHGGAIRSFVSGTITNSTIAGNQARLHNSGSGGSFRISNGTLTLNNTIVAGNVVDSVANPGQFVPNEFSLAFDGAVTGHNNLIGDAATAGGFIEGGNGNIVGINGGGAVNLLDVFRDTNNDQVIDADDVIDNGGRTRTLSLSTGSPAINAGRNDLATDADQQSLLFDQRGDGFNRIQMSTVDMGAFESNLSANPDDLILYDNATGRWRLGRSTGSRFVWTAGPRFNTTLGWQTFSGDVNGDGLIDGIGFSNTNAVFFVINNGDGTLTTTPGGSFNSSATFQYPMVGDFDGNGTTDFLAQLSTGEWFSKRWNGTQFETGFYGRWNGSGWSQFTVGDFNGDGADDIIGLRESVDGSRANFLYGLSNDIPNFGRRFAGLFAGSLGSGVATAGWHNLLMGDWNGDARDDVLVQHSGGQFFFATTSGTPITMPDLGGRRLTLSAGANFPSSTFVNDFHVGDFNQDGLDDIVSRLSSPGSSLNNSLWVGQTNFNGTVSMTRSLWGQWGRTINWGAEIVGDFNGDGIDDLAGIELNRQLAWVSISDRMTLTLTGFGPILNGESIVDLGLAASGQGD
ncbi:MAG: VCBS repeat-containing protein [Planctomycetaceae bacterium]|nr:VCBS repeat-containing protein [Planctomycetaceae bacterium]